MVASHAHEPKNVIHLEDEYIEETNEPIITKITTPYTTTEDGMVVLDDYEEYRDEPSRGAFGAHHEEFQAAGMNFRPIEQETEKNFRQTEKYTEEESQAKDFRTDDGDDKPDQPIHSRSNRSGGRSRAKPPQPELADTSDASAPKPKTKSKRRKSKDSISRASPDDIALEAAIADPDPDPILDISLHDNRDGNAADEKVEQKQPAAASENVDLKSPFSQESTQPIEVRDHPDIRRKKTPSPLPTSSKIETSVPQITPEVREEAPLVVTKEASPQKSSPAWYTGLMNTIFNPELCDSHDDRGEDVDIPSSLFNFVPCGSIPPDSNKSNDDKSKEGSRALPKVGCVPAEGCPPVEVESVSALVGNFGELASLPSLEDSIINKAGGEEDKLIEEKASLELNGSMLANKVDDVRNGEATDDGMQADQDESSADERLVKLAKDLSEIQEKHGRYDLKCAPLLSSLGELYSQRGDFNSALSIFLQIVTIYSTKLGDHHNSTIEAKCRCAKAYENAGKYDEAISMYYQIMAMRKALKNDKDPDTANNLLLIAHTLRLKGNYIQAIRELKRALKLFRDCLGDAHANVAATVDEIASLYVTLGDFEKSAAILEEVVKLKAATLGMTNKKVAQSLVDLSTSYECSENFDLSIKALKKAYKIYTDLDGFSSEEATSTLQRIALIYQASGDMNKAAIAYLGVLRGKKHLLGDDHLDVAETYFRLGVCLRETDQLDKALKCMKEALPILVGKGKDITDVEMIAEVMHEMALLYKSKRQLSEAARIFKQELTVRRKIGQPNYPCIANTLNHLGVTEYEMKMNRRALKHLLEVLTIFQDRREQGIDFAEALFNIGLVFEALKNKERAYEAFLEAARVFKNNGYSKDHPHLVKAVNKVKRLAR